MLMLYHAIHSGGVIHSFAFLLSHRLGSLTKALTYKCTYRNTITACLLHSTAAGMAVQLCRVKIGVT